MMPTLLVPIGWDADTHDELIRGRHIVGLRYHMDDEEIVEFLSNTDAAADPGIRALASYPRDWIDGAICPWCSSQSGHYDECVTGVAHAVQKRDARLAAARRSRRGRMTKEKG